MVTTTTTTTTTPACTLSATVEEVYPSTMFELAAKARGGGVLDADVTEFLTPVAASSGTPRPYSPIFDGGKVVSDDDDEMMDFDTFMSMDSLFPTTDTTLGDPPLKVVTEHPVMCIVSLPTLDDDYGDGEYEDFDDLTAMDANATTATFHDVQPWMTSSEGLTAFLHERKRATVAGPDAKKQQATPVSAPHLVKTTAAATTAAATAAVGVTDKRVPKRIRPTVAQRWGKLEQRRAAADARHAVLTGVVQKARHDIARVKRLIRFLYCK